MQNKHLNYHLTLITALLVILIAGLTGSTLVMLHRMHGKSVHTAAAERVLKQGATMVKKLATQPSITSTNSTTDWSDFSRLIRNLHSIEDGLQYVSVTRDNLVIFHEQTCRLDGIHEPAENQFDKTDNSAIEMEREVINVGGKTVPVVVFSKTVPGNAFNNTKIRLALRKDTVNREEKSADKAINSMFRLTLLTLIISFSTCVMLVVWMMRSEIKRESRRRKEEHLAFSGILANGIVHDFRNPMSSMKLDVQMLHREASKDDVNNSRISSLSERIRNTVDRMDKVFQEFLYTSRPDQDQRTNINLFDCINDSLYMLTPRFENSNIKYALNASKKDIHTLAYEGSLRRALVNILTNAIQFSPVNTTVSINIFTTAHTAVIEVSDQGCGIPKAKRNTVFNMFETERPGGTGLGLFIAKATIERNNGTIKIADNTGNTGTIVRIELPLALK